MLKEGFEVRHSKYKASEISRCLCSKEVKHMFGQSFLIIEPSSTWFKRRRWMYWTHITISWGSKCLVELIPFNTIWWKNVSRRSLGAKSSSRCLKWIFVCKVFPEDYYIWLASKWSSQDMAWCSILRRINCRIALLFVSLSCSNLDED